MGDGREEEVLMVATVGFEPNLSEAAMHLDGRFEACRE